MTEWGMTEFKHASPYTVAEIAALMGLPRKTFTQLFDREPGVIVLDRPEIEQATLSFVACSAACL